MELFAGISSQALLAFNLILGISMSVILVVTRLGLGTAATRVDVWLVGSLFLPAARMLAFEQGALKAQIGISAAALVAPLILAGLYWEAEGLRTLYKGATRFRRVTAISAAVAVTAGLAHVAFGDHVMPVLFAAANLLLLRNALALSRNYWGGRMLAGTALLLLVVNLSVIGIGAPAIAGIERRGLVLQMLWTLFSTAGFLQCLYQDLRDRLAEVAMTDALTGALNRTGLLPTLVRDLEQAKRGKSDLAVVLCDLDHFKAINDTFGHPTGDRVLQYFTMRAKFCLRTTDLLGRWGGEEFLIVLPKSTLEDAVAAINRVQQAISGSDFSPKFTFSAGVACAHEAKVQYDLEALLSTADQRLYMAKRTRNTVVCADLAPPTEAEQSRSADALR